MVKRKRQKAQSLKTIANQSSGVVVRNKIALDPRLGKGGVHKHSRKAQRARDKIKLRKECDHESSFFGALASQTILMITFLKVMFDLPSCVVASFFTFGIFASDASATVVCKTS